MSEKLLPIFLLALAGYAFGKSKSDQSGALTRALTTVAFTLFIPALLFRTTATVHLSELDGRALAAFFVPSVLLLLAVTAWGRWLGGRTDVALVRALASTFGNTVQIGIPVVVAGFGESGLAIHATIIALHALTLLTLATALMEWTLADRRHGGLAIAQAMAKQTFVNPVILPVMAGLACNLAGLRLPAYIDTTLATMAQAGVPLCLVLIGLSLAHYGVRGVVAPALGIAAVKLLIHPALVAAFAFWLLPLDSRTAAVTVLCASLPSGSNALLFAQRYELAERETTAAIVISTIAYALTISFLLAWLAAR
jgi:predicted permease